MMAKGENLLSLKREIVTLLKRRYCHPPQEKIYMYGYIPVYIFLSSRTWFYTENDAHLEHRPSQPFVLGTAAASGTGSLR